MKEPTCSLPSGNFHGFLHLHRGDFSGLSSAGTWLWMETATRYKQKPCIKSSKIISLYHYITMAIYVCYLQWVLHTPLLSRCKHTAIKYISLVRKQHQECVRLGLQFHIYGSLAGKPTRALNPWWKKNPRASSSPPYITIHHTSYQ